MWGDFLISLKTLRSLCTDFIIFLIPAFLLWQAFPYVFSVLAPFLAGYLLYLAANPLNRLLKKILPPSLCAALSLFLISFIIFFILRALFTHLFREIASLTQGSDAFSEALPFISSKMSAITSISNTSEIFSTFFDALMSGLSSLLVKISSYLIDFARNIPEILISLFATIFTAFFLLKDNSFLQNFFLSFFGEKAFSRFAEIKNSLLDAMFSYLKAQFIIGSIIFIVLFAGFFYLGVKYSLLLAFFTAIVDAVPILGTGAVLIPLSVFNFITGDAALGWGILVLYGIAVLVRQLCEPKIIGQKLGIHPLLTLFSLYAGLKLFGIVGLILGPVSAIFIKNLLLQRKRRVSV